MDLPYDLMNFHIGEKYFALQFLKFDKQDEYSIKRGGLAGEFGIIYKDEAISCQFGCSLTIGNVYSFYVSLDSAYDLGTPSVAVLKDYDDALKRTGLTIAFDKKGNYSIEGAFKSKESHYQSGICFSLKADQTYISDAVITMDRFFSELAKIQGNRNFY